MKLEIKNLEAKIENKKILKGIDLEMGEGEVHIIMGPNGSGKSTLSNVIMGHPSYEITKGEIKIDGKKINQLEADERAKKGIFLAFQQPNEVQGVRLKSFIRTAINEIRQKQGKERIGLIEFQKKFEEEAKEIRFKEELQERNLNEGFSGGEKKRSEILQMLLIEPELAILDEIDSGLDVDALKDVAKGINKLNKKGKAILLITHYERILKYVNANYVHIMKDGKIIKTGKHDLAEKITKNGYEELI